MKKLALLTLGVLFMAASAQAQTTFDPDTGFGFITKGDIQTAHGWNNGAFQQAANAGFVITYSETVVQTLACTQQNDEVATRIATRTRGVGGALAFQNRTQNQVTGVILNGYSSSSSTFGPWTMVLGNSIPGACENDNNTGWGGNLTEVSSGPAQLLVNGEAINF